MLNLLLSLPGGHLGIILFRSLWNNFEIDESLSSGIELQRDSYDARIFEYIISNRKFQLDF